MHCFNATITNVLKLCLNEFCQGHWYSTLPSLSPAFGLVPDYSLDAPFFRLWSGARNAYFFQKKIWNVDFIRPQYVTTVRQQIRWSPEILTSLLCSNNTMLLFCILEFSVACVSVTNATCGSISRYPFTYYFGMCCRPERQKTDAFKQIKLSWQELNMNCWLQTVCKEINQCHNLLFFSPWPFLDYMPTLHAYPGLRGCA